LEPLIYWDASFCISLTVETQPYHDECDAFQQRLETKGTLAVVSDFSYNELAFFLIKNALVVESRCLGKMWQQVYEDHPEFVTAIMPDVRGKTTEVEVATLQLPITEQVRGQAFVLMETYGLLPTDAYHIAVGLESGVKAFASLDQDFLRVDGIIVYTCLPF
jgi:predicted nucleic acid-binding protein